MNRLLRVVLVLGLPLAAVLIIVLSADRSGTSTSMEALASSYVSSFLDHDVVIVQYVQAHLPQSFRAEMSKASYGNTPYYVTDHRVNPNYPGQKPLPYPANDLWCVKLKSSDPKAPPVVLLALHQDIYNADWVMHEVTDPDTVLAAVGCQFTD
ncbi:MAG TPA: hypothetical protein VMP08_12390 [Anaerolineae bacterium]|nr:hypothetical protein [Anaerolineae bacterium]